MIGWDGIKIVIQLDYGRTWSINVRSNLGHNNNNITVLSIYVFRAAHKSSSPNQIATRVTADAMMMTVLWVHVATSGCI